MHRDFLKNKADSEKGAAMIVLLVFVFFITLSVVLGIVAPILKEFAIAENNIKSKQSYFLAESGIEDAAYRIKNTMQIDSSENIVLGTYSATTTIVSVGSDQKQISSAGDVNNRARKSNMILNTAAGVAFNYGVQTGDGGLDMLGSSGVNGNVYANGPITGSSSSFITGSATSVGNGAEVKVLDAEAYGNTAGTIRCGNISPVAQKFTAGSTDFISKISLISGRTSAFDCNLTIKIVNDNSGIPGTTVFSSATIPSSGISASLASQKFNLNSYSQIVSGSSYWIVFTTDGSTSSSKYFMFRQITPTPYGPLPHGFYVNTSGTWSSSYDRAILFSLYKGGLIGTIAGSSGSIWNPIHVGTSGNGNAYANTVNYANVTGTLNCQNGTGNNKSCDTSLPDPTPGVFPISDEKIEEWKSEAEAGGTVSSYSLGGSSTQTLGPKKIDGDLTVSGSATLKVTGTLYVTGNISVSGSGKIKLDTSYGSNSGVIVSDGRITISGSSPVSGSGTTGSYMIAVTTSNCPTDSSCSSNNAVNVSGSAGAVALYAPFGTINFTGSASAKTAVGYRVTLSGSTTLNYETGLANLSFNSGPSGSWSISSWKETE